MSLSPHYLQAYDLVRHVATAAVGDVEEVGALTARIRWEDGREEEVEQLDPGIRVEVRGWERVAYCWECNTRHSLVDACPELEEEEPEEKPEPVGSTEPSTLEG